MERRPDSEADEVLAQRAHTERAAFGVLYDRYVPRIFRYCLRRMGDRAEAEDATSAIFIRALERIDSYRGGSFAAWLFAIARTVVADRYRRRVVGRLDELDGVHDPGAGPDDLALSAIDRIEVATLLAPLPDDQREVLELRLAGLTGAEIAAAMGRSVPAIKMLQLRAMKRLRAESSASRRDGR